MTVRDQLESLSAIAGIRTLNSTGNASDAITVLKEHLTRHPDDRDILLALVAFSRDAGDISAALEYAEQLARIAPNDRDLASLIEDLRHRVKQPDGR
jgi:DNA-binding SARP family transcriptional activator